MVGGQFPAGRIYSGMTQGFGQHAQGRHGDEGLTIGRQGLQPIFDFVDSAVKQQRPFFVWYAPFLPHQPHNPPQRLLQKYLRDDVPRPEAKYRAMCEWFDETCGELLNFLDDRDLSHNTLVVYLCDNGWVTAVPGQNVPDDYRCAYSPYSKQSPYDGGVRTPIMFRLPSRLPPQDRADLATSLDILPTILGAAEIAAVNGFPGINLLPAMTDQRPSEREIIFGEGFWHDQTEPDSTTSSLLYRWCVKGQWKLILCYDQPESFSPSRARMPKLTRS